MRATSWCKSTRGRRGSRRILPQACALVSHKTHLTTSVKVTMIRTCTFKHPDLRIVLEIRTVILALCLILMVVCTWTLTPVTSLRVLRPLLRRLPRRPARLTMRLLRPRKVPLQVFPSRPRRLRFGKLSVAKALRRLLVLGPQGTLAHRPRPRLRPRRLSPRLLLRLRGPLRVAEGWAAT